MMSRREKMDRLCAGLLKHALRTMAVNTGLFIVHRLTSSLPLMSEDCPWCAWPRPLHTACIGRLPLWFTEAVA